MTFPDRTAVGAALEDGRDAEAAELLAGWPGHGGADAAALAAGLDAMRHVAAGSEALRTGRIDDLVRAAGDAAARAPADLPWIVFHVGSLHQAAYRFTGRPALRERTLDLLGRGADRLDLPHLAVAARGLMANVHMMHGAFDRALALADAAVALAASTGLADDPAPAMAWQFRGYVLFERNRLEEAAASLERAWALASHRAGVASGVARMMARVCDAAGDGDGANTWLDRLETVVSEPLTLRNREWLAAVRVGHELGPGELRAVESWLNAYDYRPETVAGWGDDDVRARLHELERALTLLEATSQWGAVGSLAPRVWGAADAERPWFAVRALTSEAAALEADGRSGDADARWARALTLGRAGGFVRAYIEGSPLRTTLLRRALEADDDRGGVSDAVAVRKEAERVAEVLGWLRASGGGWRGSSDAPALTPTQLAVLRRVAAGESNKAAGRALGVSVNTVRTHLRGVYERLGVGSRTHAVTKAREAGLLP